MRWVNWPNRWEAWARQITRAPASSPTGWCSQSGSNNGSQKLSREVRRQKNDICYFDPKFDFDQLCTSSLDWRASLHRSVFLLHSMLVIVRDLSPWLWITGEDQVILEDFQSCSASSKFEPKISHRQLNNRENRWIILKWMSPYLCPWGVFSVIVLAKKRVFCQYGCAKYNHMQLCYSRSLNGFWIR